MKTQQELSESFPSQLANRKESPFRVVDTAESRPSAFDSPERLWEQQPGDSPFHVVDPPEGFGFEAPAGSFATNRFEPAPTAPSSHLAVEPPPYKMAPVQAAIAAFGHWQEPDPTPVLIPTAFTCVPPAETVPEEAALQTPTAQTPATPPHAEESPSDTFHIRQLEMRAIFSMDREMDADEILQRSGALPGIRQVARVSPEDTAMIDDLKNLLPRLGFGSGTLKLYAGSVPLEFIRAGSVMLAVQTDGGFAPGIRETLMIVARELNRLG
jgi:hypothetical protein